MSASDRGASDEYSRGPQPQHGSEGAQIGPRGGAPSPSASRRRALLERRDGALAGLARVPPRSGPVAAFVERVLMALGVLGALLLIASELLTLYTVDASGAARQHLTFAGYERHAFALALIGLAVLPLTLSGVRRTPVARVAVVVLALAALLIGPIGDASVITSTGVLGTLYETAQAHAGNGYRAELVGAILVLLAGAGQLLLWLPPHGPTGRSGGPRGADEGRRGTSASGDALASGDARAPSPYGDRRRYLG